MIRLAFILSATLALGPTHSLAQTTGTEAFSQGDFSKAEQIWSQSAATGSPKAMLGLGMLADRGFNSTRDFNVAFDWYMKAAELGLAEAQFNVAVMYDAGLGRVRDAEQALVWYTRSALRDYPRAQYNLGLLYESGDGIKANADLARYWFAKAAPRVQAAADKSVASVQSPVQTAIPTVLFSDVTANSVEVVWATDATDGASYMVEVVQVPATDTGYQSPVVTRQTDGSGLLLKDVALQRDTLWRVVNRDGDGKDYYASPWQGMSDQIAPKGRITLVLSADVPTMRAAAAIFADDLRTAGYWVRLRTGEQTDSAFSARVVFGYDADREMADLVINYLPGSPDDKDVVSRPNSTQPSEIKVYFSASR